MPICSYFGEKVNNMCSCFLYVRYVLLLIQCLEICTVALDGQNIKKCQDIFNVPTVELSFSLLDGKNVKFPTSEIHFRRFGQQFLWFVLYMKPASTCYIFVL